nr:altered inheritance of mitochondria protein 18, mitochondrial [Quercus suber]
MSASARPAMRVLSPRLKCAQLPPKTSPRPRSSVMAKQLRCASTGRYSGQNPAASRRNVTTIPVTTSSFLGASEVGAATSLPMTGQNPLDVRTAYLSSLRKRDYHLQRMRTAGMGLMISFAMLVMIVWNLDIEGMDKELEEKKKKGRGGQQLDASDEANEKFQGKEVQIIGAGEGKRIVAHGSGEEIELVETGTSTIPHFPRTIFLPSDSPKAAAGASVDTSSPNSSQNPGNASNHEEYTLVGLGIRTVLFIQVYVVGMYIRTTDISALQQTLIHNVNPAASTLIPAEKESLKAKLLDPVGSREIWSELMKTPGLKTAWRIAPTRNTDFGHLRDGFVNGINARIQETRRSDPVTSSEFDAEDFGQAVQSLKAIFSGGKAPKGSILILRRDQFGALDVLFQAKPNAQGQEKSMQQLGFVADERISRLIWLGYLAGDKVSSKGAREGVVEGCVSFASRPVGSVETMVT